MTEEKVISNEEFFNNFIAENQFKLNSNIAKQQEKINRLTAKIDDIQAAQNRQKETVVACKTIIDSNAYQNFNPIFSSFSDILLKSAEKKDKKITDTKKKIKKIKKKIKKIKRKQERTNQLRGFIDTLKNPTSGQSEFIEGMKALRQDSIFKAENQLDKLNRRISKALEKFESGNLSNVDTVKLNAKVKKMESKRDKLVSKINNLNELDQELNKLAKIELVDDKVNEIKNTAVETAEKAALNGKSVESIIDIEAGVTADNIENLISSPELKSDVKKEDIKEETEKNTKTQIKNNEDNEIIEKLNSQIDYDLTVYNDITLETSKMIKDSGYMLQNGQLIKAENPTENTKNLGKKTGVTAQQALNILNADIPIQAVKDSDNTLTIVFDKSKTEQINKIIENTKIQAMKR